MSVTILETLWNARYNYNSTMPLQHAIAKMQLNNAYTLLEKGYDVSEEVEPLLEKYSDLESVPEKEG